MPKEKDLNPKISPFFIITKIRFMRIEDLLDWQMAVAIHGTNGVEGLGKLVMVSAKSSEPPNFSELKKNQGEGGITLRQWASEQGLNLFSQHS